MLTRRLLAELAAGATLEAHRRPPLAHRYELVTGSGRVEPLERDQVATLATAGLLAGRVVDPAWDHLAFALTPAGQARVAADYPDGVTHCPSCGALVRLRGDGRLVRHGFTRDGGAACRGAAA